MTTESESCQTIDDVASDHFSAVSSRFLPACRDQETVHADRKRK